MHPSLTVLAMESVTRCQDRQLAESPFQFFNSIMRMRDRQTEVETGHLLLTFSDCGRSVASALTRLARTR